MGKDKKQKKSRDEREKSDDSEKIIDNVIADTKKASKIDNGETKPSKGRKGKQEIEKIETIPIEKNLSGEESEIEIITLEQQGKSRKKKQKSKKANFSLLDLEDEDIDIKNDSADEAESIKEDKNVPNDSESKSKSESKGKKKKKDRKKRGDDDDDEDLEKILEELAIEMGTKPAEKESKESTPVEINKEADVKPAEDEEKSEKKSKKKKKEAKTEEVVEDTPDKELSPDTPSETSTVKTAAQKKKEKKEREKQKKAAQYEQSASSKKKPESAPTKPETTVDEIPETKPEDADAEDKEDDDDGDVKKKKKKKKKGEEEEKKDKKRPGKKQIAAMQEALRRVKEEEEKLRLEEEAKLKAAEEAERQRQEKLRLEQEKKEKKKQKEKEKRERLKAEGKLLTKTQKQNRARMEATLAALRQQGVEVPQIGEKKEKVPRLGDRKRQKKKSQEEAATELPKIEDLKITDNAEKEDDKEPVEEEQPELKDSTSVSEEENIKDAWDETSDEEESEKIETATKKVSKTEVVSKPSKKAADSESESEETDSSEEESESESDEESYSSSDSEGDGKVDQTERIRLRIQRRRESAENNRSVSKLRSPVVCVLGHVDTGKTKILDKIRSSHVQDNEEGGITQQIGATMVPRDAIQEQCKMVKNFNEMELKVPGLLIIDTPGHESFSNLRSRGSSLCDIAILVVDITHGLEAQTIESLNMLKQRKTPFVVALNKIDRVYEWKSTKSKDVQDIIKSQSRSTRQFFEDRVKQVILEFANQSLNAVLYFENPDPRQYISMVPTSALTGEGMGNLMALIVELTQSMMAKRLAFSEELQATVLEVKAIAGLGHTMDAILVNGCLREGDTIVFSGYDGPQKTQIRSLLMPQPMKELRIKTQFIEHREVEGAQGVKICAKELEKAIAGLPILVPHRADEIPILMEEVATLFKETMNAIKVTGMGVYVQTSTLGSLEALMEFLSESKIPVSGVRIGPVTKKDVMRASAMLEHDPTFAVILAFDVRIEREAQELADSLSIKIFHANIIYHLFDMFVKYRSDLKEKNREMYKNAAVFPCKLKILPQFIFNSRDPIVVGVSIEAGVLKEGTPLCVPSKDFLDIGTVSTIEVNHKTIETARKGQEVCIKIEPLGGEAPKMYGRHFDHADMLVSKISRHSIDMCKEHFRDDLLKSDWQLMVELKKLFQIL